MPDQPQMPAHLVDHAETFRTDPRAASLEWFRGARFGLFMHYGLYAQLGRGEWVQLAERIPVAEYEKLAETFSPDGFDAEAIADLAVAAEMKYVNITTRHHDSFCLFRTAETDFNSVAACGRDLAGELAEACASRGLGLFWYYSYGLDWRHPWFYSREHAGGENASFPNARPDYDQPQPEYLYREPADFRKYIDFTHAQLRELLTRYGPVAGVWFDPIMGYYARPDLFPIEETYALIRSLQPHALICFKQGANGEEDFVAPERHPRCHPAGGEVGRRAWERNAGKPIEICDTLQAGKWGYNASEDGRHRKPPEVRAMLAHAAGVGANLLLNTGPLPDGTLPPEDVHTLRAVGEDIRTRGWPTADEAAEIRREDAGTVE
jgi:alpha-L-fucosidase